MAEFKRFDPDRWEPEVGDGGVAKAAKPAKLDADEQPTFATLATLASAGDALPGTIVAGLAALDGAKPPRGVAAPAWRLAVRDAHGLAADGWAASAISLGWSPLDLFGVVPDLAGDPHGDGLAVKLSGRKVLAICASFATVADTNGGRSYLYRRSSDGAVLLWALGRGR